MRTLALALLSCGLLSLPVAASAAPHRTTAKKPAHAATKHAKVKARHSAGKAAHAARTPSGGRYATRAQHS